MRRLRDTFTRSIAWTAGRILTALALAAALAYFGMGEAKAADVAPCLTTGGCDQGRAFQEASKYASSTMQCPVSQSFQWQKQNPRAVVDPSNPGNRYIAQIDCMSPTNNGYTVTYTHPDRWFWSGSCSARADLVGLMVSSFANGTVCSFGCSYSPKSRISDTTITDKSTPANSLRFSVLQDGDATGNTCTNPSGADGPKGPGDEPPACLAVGTDSAGTIYHCPKEDGGSCTVSGRGTKFCQPPPPGTQGPKVDTGRQDANSQSASQGTPPQPPAPRPGESWGPGPGSTVCNNITGTCSESNTYVNNGTPNVNGTPITGDGSGTNGTGQQEGGAGTGTGTGGSGAGTDMGPTNALLGDIKGLLGSEGQADTTFEGQIDGAFAGENDVPDNDEHADPTDGIKQVRDGNWLTDQLDDAGFLGGGQCPADIQVNVGTTSIPLTFGPICQLLSAISGLVMAASYLLAFRIMTA